VATLGPDGGNSLQFTGRENDGIGTYLYRARTFDPILKRFTSEDPIGIDGGINLYAYVHGNPLRYTDPLGLDTYLGGIGVTLIAGFGIEGGLGLLLNPGSDDECFDIGIYGSIAV
jgi:RHS repeat-associated protein